MILFDNEKIITSSDNEEVILTNQRIVKDVKYALYSVKKSVFLENIDALERGYKGNVMFLYASIFFFFLAILMYIVEKLNDFQPFAYILLIFSLIFYFLSRGRYIAILTKGGKSIEINVRKMSNESADEFLNMVQKAKLKRINELNTEKV